MFFKIGFTNSETIEFRIHAISDQNWKLACMDSIRIILLKIVYHYWIKMLKKSTSIKAQFWRLSSHEPKRILKVGRLNWFRRAIFFQLSGIDSGDLPLMDLVPDLFDSKCKFTSPVLNLRGVKFKSTNIHHFIVS